MGRRADTVPNTRPRSNFDSPSPAQPFASDQNAGCPGAKHRKGLDVNEGLIGFFRGRPSSKDEREEGFLLEDTSRICRRYPKTSIAYSFSQ